jgi:O-antigen/teichoic acid export membrane protein
MALGLSVYYFVNDNASLGVAMLVIGSFSPFLSSSNLYNAYLEAKKDFRRSAIYFSIIGNLFPSICLFLGMLFLSKPLELVIIYFTSNTLIGLIMYAQTLKVYRPNKKIDPGAMNYTKHLSVMGILGGLASNIDQILIFHYIGGVELAIYNFAIAIPKQIKGPIKGLASLIFPKFSERSDKEIKEGMANKILLLFISAALIIIAYIFAAPYIFKLLFPKYISSIFYSQVFSISLLWIISIPAETYLLAKRKLREQYIGTITIPLVQLIFLTIGILWGGLLGLIIARVVTSLLSSLLSIILSNKALKKAIATGAS